MESNDVGNDSSQWCQMTNFSLVGSKIRKKLLQPGNINKARGTLALGQGGDNV